MCDIASSAKASDQMVARVSRGRPPVHHQAARGHSRALVHANGFTLWIVWVSTRQDAEPPLVRGSFPQREDTLVATKDGPLVLTK